MPNVPQVFLTVVFFLLAAFFFEFKLGLGNSLWLKKKKKHNVLKGKKQMGTLFHELKTIYGESKHFSSM